MTVTNQDLVDSAIELYPATGITIVGEGTEIRLDDPSIPLDEYRILSGQEAADVRKRAEEIASERLQATLINSIKKEAGRRIDKFFPEYKQRNYIARQSELDRIETGTMRDGNGDLIAARTLTAQEIAELVAIKGVWDWIVSVRIASNLIEGDPPNLLDIQTDARWPADPA